MDLSNLERIPEVVRNALGTVLAGSAVEQVVGVLKDGLRSLQHLAEVASRVTKVEDEVDRLAREMSELRAHLVDIATRADKLEAQGASQSRELSELRVRIHGATTRIVRVEEQTGHHTRELSELRVRVEHADDRVPQVSLETLEQHLRENERRIAAALAEIQRQIAAGAPRDAAASGEHRGG